MGGRGPHSVNLIIMGPPGSGKGTQGERIAERYHIPQISTGDILRDAVKDGSTLGLRAKAFMDYDVRSRKQVSQKSSAHSGKSAMPARRRRFELGLWLTEAPASAMTAISSSLSQTPWAMEKRGPSTPSSWRCTMVGLP